MKNSFHPPLQTVTSGEGLEQLILNALRNAGCIVSESTIIPLPNFGGWMFCINLRRPRWFSRWFGYGPEQHLNITAKKTPGKNAVRYTTSCMRVDGKGSLKQGAYRSIGSLLFWV